MTSRNDEIPGYIHPTEGKVVGRTTGIYKTFTEGSDTDFKKLGTTTANALYGHQEIAKKEKCPVCRGSAVIFCNCVYSCKSCDNGHWWFLDRDFIVKKGKGC